MPGGTGLAFLLPPHAACSAHAHLAKGWVKFAASNFTSFVDDPHETNALTGDT